MSQSLDFNLDSQASGVRILNHCPTLHHSHYVKEQDSACSRTDQFSGFQKHRICMKEVSSRSPKGWRNGQEPGLKSAFSARMLQCLVLGV